MLEIKNTDVKARWPAYQAVRIKGRDPLKSMVPFFSANSSVQKGGNIPDANKLVAGAFLDARILSFTPDTSIISSTFSAFNERLRQYVCDPNLIARYGTATNGLATNLVFMSAAALLRAAETNLIKDVEFSAEFIERLKKDIETQRELGFTQTYPDNTLTDTFWETAGQPFLAADAGYEDTLEYLRSMGADVIDTENSFIETSDGVIAEGQSDPKQPYIVKTHPRLTMVVQLMQKMGIQPNELRIYTGIADPEKVRKLPYIIVEIQTLNKQIAVCDQVGEITFVSNQIESEEFWRNITKPELKSEPKKFRAIRWLKDPADWLDDIEDTLNDTYDFSKVKAKVDYSFDNVELSILGAEVAKTF